MTSTRTITIDIDTRVGNRIYWLIREPMERYPKEFREIKEAEKK